MGGARAGERVRLKLETPLFVADALLAAAGLQLQNELATAVEVGRKGLNGAMLLGFYGPGRAC